MQSSCDLAAFAALPPEAIRLRPLALLHGRDAAEAVERGAARPLAGTASAFAMVGVEALHEHRRVAGTATLQAVHDWAKGQLEALAARIAEQLAALSRPRAAWVGLRLDRPLIMGILNVTPDSFSDGGAFVDPERAIAHGRAMLADGADLIDIGGESTRPGAAPVPPHEELARVERVVAALAEAGAVVSIDTRHALVMDGAVARGARIINDVTALTGDPAGLGVAARTGVAVALMHMQGDSRTMQQDPRYDDAPLEVTAYLAGRIAACGAAGIAADRIVVDPGIGFGKTAAHNLAILDRIGLLHGLGCGVLLGVSRKSIIGRIASVPAPSRRLPGSLAAALQGIGEGVQIVRVHDVAETRQAILVRQAIVTAE